LVDAFQVILRRFRSWGRIVQPQNIHRLRPLGVPFVAPFLGLRLVVFRLFDYFLQPCHFIADLARFDPDRRRVVIAAFASFIPSTRVFACCAAGHAFAKQRAIRRSDVCSRRTADDWSAKLPLARQLGPTRQHNCIIFGESAEMPNGCQAACQRFSMAARFATATATSPANVSRRSRLL